MTVEVQNPCGPGRPWRGPRPSDIRSPTRMLPGRRATASTGTRMAHVEPAVAMIDILRRGVGLVTFQTKPHHRAGIGINSYKYSSTVLLGFIVATLAADLLPTERSSANGLFGFKGALTGITFALSGITFALSVFLQ
jgi:Urea transporter